MKHDVGQIAVTNLTNSTVTIRATLLPGQSRAIKIAPYKTISVDRDIIVMALAEFRKDKAKGIIWFDENEIFADNNITGIGGITGTMGGTGTQGETGIGTSGATGLQGETGIGTTGPVGPVGETGVQGTTGLPGSTLIYSILDDDQISANLASLTFPKTLEGFVLQYKAKLLTTGSMRVGTIYVANDGSSASVQDNYAETENLGITWDTFVDSTNLYLLYTTSLKSSQRSLISSIQLFL
jgi:hypothetical protein